MLAAGGLCYGTLRRNPTPRVRRKVHRLLRVPPTGLPAPTVREALAPRAHRPALSEGLPVPREPAYAGKRSQDGEAQSASE